MEIMLHAEGKQTGDQITTPRTKDEEHEVEIDAADRALDVFLRMPSRTPSRFIEKIQALVSEYGCEWQPRHIEALVHDLEASAI